MVESVLVSLESNNEAMGDSGGTTAINPKNNGQKDKEEEWESTTDAVILQSSLPTKNQPSSSPTLSLLQHSLEEEPEEQQRRQQEQDDHGRNQNEEEDEPRDTTSTTTPTSITTTMTTTLLGTGNNNNNNNQNLGGGGGGGGTGAFDYLDMFLTASDFSCTVWSTPMAHLWTALMTPTNGRIHNKDEEGTVSEVDKDDKDVHQQQQQQNGPHQHDEPSKDDIRKSFAQQLLQELKEREGVDPKKKHHHRATTKTQHVVSLGSGSSPECNIDHNHNDDSESCNVHWVESVELNANDVDLNPINPIERITSLRDEAYYQNDNDIDQHPENPQVEAAVTEESHQGDISDHEPFTIVQQESHVVDEQVVVDTTQDDSDVRDNEPIDTVVQLQQEGATQDIDDQVTDILQQNDDTLHDDEPTQEEYSDPVTIVVQEPGQSLCQEEDMEQKAHATTLIAPEDAHETNDVKEMATLGVDDVDRLDNEVAFVEPPTETLTNVHAHCGDALWDCLSLGADESGAMAEASKPEDIHHEMEIHVVVAESVQDAASDASTEDVLDTHDRQGTSQGESAGHSSCMVDLSIHDEPHQHNANNAESVDHGNCVEHVESTQQDNEEFFDEASGESEVNTSMDEEHENGIPKQDDEDITGQKPDRSTSTTTPVQEYYLQYDTTAQTEDDLTVKSNVVASLEEEVTKEMTHTTSRSTHEPHDDDIIDVEHLETPEVTMLKARTNSDDIVAFASSTGDDTTVVHDDCGEAIWDFLSLGVEDETLVESVVVAEAIPGDVHHEMEKAAADKLQDHVSHDVAENVVSKQEGHGDQKVQNNSEDAGGNDCDTGVLIQADADLHHDRDGAGARLQEDNTLAEKGITFAEDGESEAPVATKRGDDSSRNDYEEVDEAAHDESVDKINEPKLTNGDDDMVGAPVSKPIDANESTCCHWAEPTETVMMIVATQELEAEGSPETGAFMLSSEYKDLTQDNLSHEPTNDDIVDVGSDLILTIEEPPMSIEEPPMLIEETQKSIKEPQQSIEEPQKSIEEPQKSIEEPPSSGVPKQDDDQRDTVSGASLPTQADVCYENAASIVPFHEPHNEVPEHEEVYCNTDNDVVVVVYQGNAKEVNAQKQVSTLEDDAHEVGAANSDDNFHTFWVCAGAGTAMMTMSTEEDLMNDASRNPRPFVESSGVENNNMARETRALADMDCADAFWYVLLTDDVEVGLVREPTLSEPMAGAINEHGHDDNKESTSTKHDDIHYRLEMTMESPEYDIRHDEEDAPLGQEAVSHNGDDADVREEALAVVDENEAFPHEGDDADAVEEALAVVDENEAVSQESDDAYVPEEPLDEVDDHETAATMNEETNQSKDMTTQAPSALDFYYYDDNQMFQGQKEKQRCHAPVCSIM